MDKKLIALSLGLGVVANVLYAALVLATQIPQYIQWALIIVLLFITPFLLLSEFRFYQHGLVRIGQAADGKFSLPFQFKASEKSLYFMGVSARTIMNPHLETMILNKILTNHDYTLKFLLFDRTEIEKLKRRATEETGDQNTAIEWAEVMHSTIQMLLRIKRNLGDAGERLQVRTYKSFPVFRMIIVDDRLILLNHYPKSRFPFEMPYLQIRFSGDPATIGYAVKKYFDEIWIEAEPATN